MWLRSTNNLTGRHHNAGSAEVCAMSRKHHARLACDTAALAATTRARVRSRTAAAAVLLWAAADVAADVNGLTDTRAPAVPDRAYGLDHGNRLMEAIRSTLAVLAPEVEWCTVA